jgi:hypothetical protein
MLAVPPHKTLLPFNILLTNPAPYHSTLRLRFAGSSSQLLPNLTFAGCAFGHKAGLLQEMAHWEHRGSINGRRLCVFVAAFILGGVSCPSEFSLRVTPLIAARS